MSMLHIGIAGAGLLGRLVAWTLVRQLGSSCRIEVFDPADGPEPRFDGHGAAAFTAAGLLSPLAEQDVASAATAALGWRSLDLWPRIVAALPGTPYFAARGSLLLAHRSDAGAAQRLLARLPAPAVSAAAPQALTTDQLGQLEPALQGIAQAWLLPGEGQIDPIGTLRGLHEGTRGAHVRWHWRAPVAELRHAALRVESAGASAWRGFDAVFDLRGLGARPPLPLRGVRGETVWLHAPGHGLTRPVRLLHPRHRVYIAPRPGDLLVVGASEIESEDRSEVSLKSAVELMAAAHSVPPALQEARILRLDRNLRPALPDNEPCVEVQPGLVRINGLFRHGWLLAPALVEDALARWRALLPAVTEAVA
ncbi:FAD-dependent oxidoreductase [Aquabacterium sp.]|uniref:FAD-dependent oxidoreductase n=1 Tax=Aquabacterium sp. TaxID=1872578 RepID=UPI003783E56C